MKKLLLILILSLSCPAFSQQHISANPAKRQELAAVTSEPALSSRQGAIEISCPPDKHTYTFQIYAITGQLIKKIQLSESSATVEVPRGCYIVKCDSWVKKVIVK